MAISSVGSTPPPVTQETAPTPSELQKTEASQPKPPHHGHHHHGHHHKKAGASGYQNADPNDVPGQYGALVNGAGNKGEVSS